MLRLYNHPICPFAERARLAFLAKDIKHQIVHVELNGKPDWFVETGGVVPVLETPEGDLIPESDIVVQYALDSTKGGIELVPEDLVEAAKMRVYIKRRDNGFLVNSFKAVAFGDEESRNKMGDQLQQIEEDLSKNDEAHPYLLQRSEISLADIILSPVLVRNYFALVENLSTISPLKISDYPNITKYVENIIHHPTLARGFICKWGYLNFVKAKNENRGINLPYPFDVTPFEDSQSQKSFIIPDALTARPLKNEKFVRLYGHDLCPFVQRAMLTLRAKNIPYQYVGIDLTHKNSWHWNINKGLVPLIEHPDGTLVHDSLDV